MNLRIGHSLDQCDQLILLVHLVIDFYHYIATSFQENGWFLWLH